MPHSHWILMNGTSGCMPDSCDAYAEQKQAVESAAQRFDDLSDRAQKRMLRDLRQYGIHYFDNARTVGADYVEVVDCDCESPWEHSETGERDSWPEYPDGESA